MGLNSACEMFCPGEMESARAGSAGRGFRPGSLTDGSQDTGEASYRLGFQPMKWAQCDLPPRVLRARNNG